MSQSVEELLQLALSGLNNSTPPPTQRIRTFVQGVTSGHGEEIEAAVRAAVPGQPEYQTIRDDLRQKLRAYKEANPTESLVIETTGAAAPVVAAMLAGGPAGASAASRSLLSRLGRGTVVGGAEGLAAGAGYSEADTPVGVLRDAGQGGAMGAVISPVLGLAAEGVGLASGSLVRRAREFMGDRAATAVQAELQRLAQATGNTVDEIVADVMDGRIMSDNRTLRAALRAYRTEGGTTGAYVMDQVPLRAAQTRRDAMTAMQEGLTPNTDGNVFAAQRRTSDELKRLEGDDFARVFGDRAEVTPEIQETLQDIIQRMPDARNEVAAIYSNDRRLAPLFTTRENGAIELVRIPTIEDAEIVRRALSDAQDKAFKSGSGALGNIFRDAQGELRGLLDEAFPALQEVRQNSARRFTISEQFEEGRKAFNMPSDELEVVVSDLSRRADPAALQAFRAGAMDAIRDKANRPGNFMYRLGSENTRERSLVEILFPREQADDVLRRIGIAGEADDVARYVIGGSPTEDTRAAAVKIGSRGSVEDLARAASGDPMALMRTLQRGLARGNPGLTDTQRMEVVQVLFSQNPDLVRRALTDDTATARLMERAGVLANALAAGGQRAAAQTGARGVVTQGGEQ